MQALYKVGILTPENENDISTGTARHVCAEGPVLIERHMVVVELNSNGSAAYATEVQFIFFPDHAWLTRRCKLLKDEEAICALTPDRFPQAKPKVLLRVLHELHIVQEKAVFQADMSTCISSVAKDTR